MMSGVAIGEKHSQQCDLLNSSLAMGTKSLELTVPSAGSGTPLAWCSGHGLMGALTVPSLAVPSEG